MSQSQETIWVKVTGGFVLDVGKYAQVGDVMELPRRFGTEMVASNKAVEVPKPVPQEVTDAEATASTAEATASAAAAAAATADAAAKAAETAAGLPPRGKLSLSNK
jgi:hypothetical protein